MSGPKKDLKRIWPQTSEKRTVSLGLHGGSTFPPELWLNCSLWLGHRLDWVWVISASWLSAMPRLREPWPLKTALAKSVILMETWMSRISQCNEEGLALCCSSEESNSSHTGQSCAENALWTSLGSSHRIAYGMSAKTTLPNVPLWTSTFIQFILTQAKNTPLHWYWPPSPGYHHAGLTLFCLLLASYGLFPHCLPSPQYFFNKQISIIFSLRTSRELIT